MKSVLCMVAAWALWFTVLGRSAVYESHVLQAQADGIAGRLTAALR